MTNVKKAANAIGGKTARACESCLRKRARWYCAADDAFLCQGCDTTVHSANRLASRHERTRLQTSSLKTNDVVSSDQNSPPPPPAWHHGFTRKARTPRNSKPAASQPRKDEKNIANANPISLVPEIGNDEGSLYEEEQLLCRVPVFYPFACTDLFEVPNEIGAIDGKYELDLLATENGGEACNLDLQGFLPSKMELAKFAADVESLLGGADEETNHVVENKVGLTDSNKEERIDVCFDSYRVKVEDEEVQALIASHLDPALDMAKDTTNWNLFSCESLLTGKDETEEKAVTKVENTFKTECKEEIKRKKFLRLNYEEVISAWSNHNSSPWTTGTRPEFNPDDFFSDFMGTCSEFVYHNQKGGMRVKMEGDVGDREREARVSRYREKRRTRLFSKKIRYEVRKLNAEKRPRMKGRFVKRTSSSFAGHPPPAASPFTCSFVNK